MDNERQFWGKGAINDERPLSRIPDFASRAEEAAWFDAHDIGDYLDEFSIIDHKEIVVRLKDIAGRGERDKAVGPIAERTATEERVNPSQPYSTAGG